MLNRFGRVLCIFVAAGAWGCFDRVAGGAGAGNPPLAEVSLALEAKSAVPPPAKFGAYKEANLGGPFNLKDSLGFPITLSGIEIRVDKIEFSLPDSATCKPGSGPCLDKEIGLKGDFRMDLVTGKANPEIGVIKIPPGRYEKIGLNPVGSDSIPGSGRPQFNLLLAGKAGAPGSVRGFVMEIDVEEGLDFQAPAGIRIAPDSLTRIRLSLSVDDWFKGVDLRACLDGIVNDSAGIARIRGVGACVGAVERVGGNLQDSEDLEEEEESKR